MMLSKKQFNKIYESIMSDCQKVIKDNVHKYFLNESYQSSLIKKILINKSLVAYNAIYDGKKQLTPKYTNIGAVTDKDIFVLKVGQWYDYREVYLKLIKDFHLQGWNLFGVGLLSYIKTLYETGYRSCKKENWSPCGDFLKHYTIDENDILVKTEGYEKSLKFCINKITPRVEYDNWMTADSIIVEQAVSGELKAFLVFSNQFIDLAYIKRTERKNYQDTKNLDPLKVASQDRAKKIHAYDGGINDEKSRGFENSYGEYKNWVKDIKNYYDYLIEFYKNKTVNPQTKEPYSLEELCDAMEHGSLYFRNIKTDKVFKKWVEKHYPNLFSCLKRMGCVE